MKRIKLTRKKGPSLWAIVNNEDFYRVVGKNYFFAAGCSTGYAKRLRGKCKSYSKIIPMAWDIIGIENRRKGLVIDHKNGNGLDNRRENLEIVTHAENVRRGHRGKRFM